MDGAIVGAIIGGIVLLAAIVLVMTFLLSSYLLSKILCFVTGGIAIGFGAKAASIINAAAESGIYMWDAENVDWAIFMIWAVILSAACWLFFIGPTVLDEEWDGTFTIHSTLTGYDVTPNMSGGLIGNGIGALLLFAFGYFLISDEFAWPAIMVVIPIVIMTFNLLGLLRSFIFNR